MVSLLHWKKPSGLRKILFLKSTSSETDFLMLMSPIIVADTNYVERRCKKEKKS